MARTWLQLQDEALSNDFDPLVYRERTKRFLNDALDDLARAATLPLMESTADLGVTAGNASYDIPAGVRLISIYNAVDREELEEIDVRERDLLNTTSRGKPIAFSLYGNQIFLWPTPGDTYTIKARFLADPAEITSDAAGTAEVIPDAYAPALVNYARAELFALEDDFQMSDWWRGRYKEAKARLKGDVARRNRSGVRQVPGAFSRLPVGPRFQRP